MTVTAPSHPLSLDTHHLVEFHWQRGTSPAVGIPTGLVLVHRNARNPFLSCRAYFSWAKDPSSADWRLSNPTHLWTLVSLRPLTLAEPIVCILCGEVGRIEDDKWIPSGPKGDET